jgi:PleD family two-component response regulator
MTLLTRLSGFPRINQHLSTEKIFHCSLQPQLFPLHLTATIHKNVLLPSLQTAPRSPSGEEPMVQSSSQLRVFIVDDHDVIASSLAMILQFLGGFHATSFTDPREALRAAQFESPDLLITDVVMPQLSGIDLAIQVLDRCRNCKVLLFSGQTATDSLLKSAQERGYDFELLAKPVHPADLLSKIQRVFEDKPLQLSASKS